MRRTLAALASASLLTLAACSSSGGGYDADSGGDSAVRSDPESAGDVARAPAAAEARGPAAAAPADAGSTDAGGGQAARPATAQRAVISTGNVALRSDDVGRALFDVRRVVDQAAGEVAEENTDTDDTGGVVRSRLVVRVPAARFDATMQSLKGAADLITAGSTSEDVTTQVLDVDVRVRVQRSSIQRIELLLSRAESIADIVAIEAQLSRRQADLASLEQQQTYLADQTALSTITVSLERTPEKREATEKKDDDEAGFLSGLDAGWDALRTFGVGVATLLGAVLPWTLVALVLGVPGRVLLLRARRTARTP